MTSSASAYNVMYQNQTRQPTTDLQSPSQLGQGQGGLRGFNHEPSPSSPQENMIRSLQRTQPMLPSTTSPPQMQPGTPAAKAEVPRTPLALLNEIMLKSKLTAEMEVSDGAGPVHSRVFECKIKVERNNLYWEGVGKGASKKDAKQEAALALLRQMDEKTVEMITYTPQSKAVPARIDGDVDADVSGNPIGDLNDLCMRSRIPPPEYEEGEHDQSTIQQIFTITCRLNAKTAEDGRGPTKKYAKRVAADKVLQKLKQAIQDPAQAPSLFPDLEQDALCQKLASLSVSKKPKGGLDLSLHCGPAKPVPLAEVVQSIKGITGQKWEKLMGMKAADIKKSDQTVILADVAEEQKMKVEYLDFLPQPDDNMHNAVVYVTVGSNPPVVCPGNGAGPQQARKSAASNVLQYFRLCFRN